MKNVIVFFAAVGALLTTAMQVSAQSLHSLAKQETSLPSRPSGSAASRDGQVLADLQSNSPGVYRHFLKDFKSPERIMVQAVKKNRHITFSEGNQLIRVLYNQRGVQLYAVYSYPAADIPAWVSDRVQSAYPCHAIFGTGITVKIAGKTAYLVMIRKGDQCKRVRIVGDEMDEYEKFVLAAS